MNFASICTVYKKYDQCVVETFEQVLLLSVWCDTIHISIKRENMGNVLSLSGF